MQLRTEIDIAAEPEKVWQVLTDFRAYPQWNPFIVRIAGKPAAGESLKVVISPPERSEMRFAPKVLLADRASELRWRGVFGFRWLFCGEHFFRMERIEPGRTRFTHGEDFSGWLVRFAPMTQTARGFVFMNQALKRRVESL
jgi:hypothetical protein